MLCVTACTSPDPRLRALARSTLAMRLWIAATSLFAVMPLAQAGKTDNAPSASKVTPPSSARNNRPAKIQCLSEAGGYLNARLTGSIDKELALSGAELECTGAIRPGGSGLRLRFRTHATHADPGLVLVFGISGLKEGETQQALPVNLTLIREGKGEFYATQGDGKCTADKITQSPLTAFPFKQRSWRVEVHGFCTQPARAVNGEGSVLVTRFDFAGRADFSSEDTDEPAPASLPDASTTAGT